MPVLQGQVTQIYGWSVFCLYPLKNIIIVCKGRFLSDIYCVKVESTNGKYQTC